MKQDVINRARAMIRGGAGYHDVVAAIPELAGKYALVAYYRRTCYREPRPVMLTVALPRAVSDALTASGRDPAEIIAVAVGAPASCA